MTLARPLTLAPANPQASSGYHVVGRYLHDPNGDRVIVRGVEQRFWKPWLDPTGNYLPDIARTGANAVRLLPFYPPEDQNPPGGLTNIGLLSALEVRALVDRALANHMIPYVCIGGSHSITSLLDPAMRAQLLPVQDRIVVDANGEGTQPTAGQWMADAVSSIRQLRAAGYTCPLTIMSNDQGRNVRTLLNHGQDVLSADPLGNVVFGWQAYWGGSGHWQQRNRLTLTEAIHACAEAQFPIQLGLLYKTDLSSPGNENESLDYQTAMALAAQLQLGWLWWEWELTGGGLGPGEDLIAYRDAPYGTWMPGYGEDVAVLNPHGLRSARRTRYSYDGTRA